MPTFSQILSKPSIFKDRNTLSSHYVPDILPFREEQIEKIMNWVAPALKNERPRNVFVYGKTGTGKTASVRHVMKKFEEEKPMHAKTCYMNCRIYNSRYRVMQKITKDFIPEMDKAGFGVATLYEKILAWIAAGSFRLIIVLDEVDMVSDLDELMYTLTRANDDLKQGSISLIGISNKLDFKNVLDPRSRSSLCETEMVFAPYSANQLQAILLQRSQMGFGQGIVDESAINFASAIAAQETGDARYALRLLLKAGELADEHSVTKITDKEVEDARKSVDSDIASEIIATLPDQQQIVLYAASCLTLGGSKYAKLFAGTEDEDGKFLSSGEVYEEYTRACKGFKRKKRSSRWYREYLNDLEMLGLITMVDSGPGMRGHTRLIKVGYPPTEIKVLIEKNFMHGKVHTAEDEEAGGTQVKLQ